MSASLQVLSHTLGIVCGASIASAGLTVANCGASVVVAIIIGANFLAVPLGLHNCIKVLVTHC